MTRLLLVDDDAELCELISEYLEGEGFSVSSCHDGRTALRRNSQEDFELVILDVMLPEINGFDVLRRIRESSSVPVIMLTARGEEVDRIVGLEIGADDYLAKPFNPRELSARIRAILRRVGGQVLNPVVSTGDLSLDPASRSVRRNQELVELTGVEFGILEVLLTAAGQVVSRDQLSRKALGRRTSSLDRSLDVHLSNIRRKLGPLPDGGERIKTVRGVGYLYVRSQETP